MYTMTLVAVSTWRERTPPSSPSSFYVHFGQRKPAEWLPWLFECLTACDASVSARTRRGRGGAIRCRNRLREFRSMPRGVSTVTHTHTNIWSYTTNAVPSLVLCAQGVSDVREFFLAGARWCRRANSLRRFADAINDKYLVDGTEAYPNFNAN